MSKAAKIDIESEHEKINFIMFKSSAHVLNCGKRRNGQLTGRVIMKETMLLWSTIVRIANFHIKYPCCQSKIVKFDLVT